jgi:hypothetical protein
MHVQRIPSQSDLLQLFHKAGLRPPTGLQQRVIPLVLKGKDLVAHAEKGSGATVAIVVSLIVGIRGGETRPRALVIVHGAGGVEAFERTWSRFARSVREAPLLLALGAVDDVRREERRLEKGAAVVVGTVDRVIDHIRRGSLSFAELEVVLVEPFEGAGGEGSAAGAPASSAGGAAPGSSAGSSAGAAPVSLPEEALSDFMRDAEFVFAKFPPRCQAVVFSRTALGEKEGLAALVRRPVFLAAADMQAGAGSPVEHLVVHAAGGRSAEALSRLLLGRALAPVLVLHSPRADGQGLAAALRASLVRAEALPPGAAAARRRLFTSFAAREIEVLVLPIPPGGRLVQSELEELQPRTVLYYDIPAARPARDAGRQETDRGAAGAPGSPSRRGPAIVVLSADGQEKDLERFQEAMAVTLQPAEVPGKDEVLGGAIARIVERIRSEADPKELARLRATIRRRVPFFMRSWFAAWLLQSHLPFEAESAQGQPRPQQGRPQQARPLQDRPSQARPLQGKPSQARPQQGRPPQDRPSQARPPGQPSRPAPVRSPSGRPQSGLRPQPAQAAPAPRGTARPDQKPEAGKPGFTQLFVSIGRNRKVFARDLEELFTSTLALFPGEVSDVRVFDKYSFVDIASARAPDAIEKLSGTVMKGRTITVNYAKKKEEKEQS